VLWYKAWLETQSRFLISLLTLTTFCALFVHHALRTMDHPSRSDISRLLYITQLYIVVIWILAVVILGMGGIVRERAIGTSSLTLALPVNRTHVVGVRIGVGVLEAVSLGIIPWMTVFLLVWLTKPPVSFRQVGEYVLLLVGGGLVYFAIAILISSIIPGEYTAPAITFGAVLLSIIVLDGWLRGFDLWRLITGDLLLNRNTYLLSGRLPWLGILGSLSMAVLMFLGSMAAVQKSDF
jgi:ABC-2 type transport system permease protein